MKIALCSDLHLEFGPIELQNTNNADVLILGGDICTVADIIEGSLDSFMAGAKSKRIVDFFKNCSAQFPHVVYVMGNHEHYHGDFATSGNKIKSLLESNMLSNVYLLEKESKKIDDVTFVGGTLWTDMNNDNEMTKFHVTRRMNDFQCVQNSTRMVTRTVPLYELNPNYTPDGKNGGKYLQNEAGFHIKIGEKKKQEPSSFSPQDAFDDHKKMLQYIQSVIEGKFDEKFVVVGHHAPSRLSTHPRYKHDTLMNGAYSSSLDEYILEHPQIKLWTHGHTHDRFDYMVGSTRVVCNPRGYDGYEAIADTFELVYLDV
jgi:Icc-related predicted phosphoesterase